MTETLTVEGMVGQQTDGMPYLDGDGEWSLVPVGIDWRMITYDTLAHARGLVLWEDIIKVVTVGEPAGQVIIRYLDNGVRAHLSIVADTPGLGHIRELAASHLPAGVVRPDPSIA